MRWLRTATLGLVPPRCAACGRACPAEAPLCGRCARRLGEAEPLFGPGPPGLDRVWSSAAYEGAARDLVLALKFRRLLPVADVMAERIAWRVPRGMLGGPIVPVPPAPLRLMRRGFDPAGELAAAVAERLGASLCPCLQRTGSGRQRGRGRAQRMSRPPAIRACAPAPRSAVLVDDVLTTGATLSACARALREAGALRVVAVTFSRRP